VTAVPAAKLRGYAALTAALVWAAIALHRPELVAVAAPFGLLLAIGLAATVPPEVTVAIDAAEIRAIEGDTVTLAPELRPAPGTGTVGGLAIDVHAPSGMRPALPRRVVRLEEGVPTVIAVEMACDRWGGYLAGGMTLRAPGPLRLVRFEQAVEPTVPVRVYPPPETLRALPRPGATHVGAGNYVTRVRGEGLEFADLRPHAPGDQLRRVNWRVSARRGRLHVNEYHPERNADVVLFLDSFADTRHEAGGTIDMTVRAGAALAAAYLRTRDRVGVVGFGGVLRWVLPATGTTQAYRILDSLIDTQVVASYAWRGVSVIPARTLPVNALVVALSPLADARMLAALGDLRARGIDLAVIDVSPVPFVAPPPGPLGDLAHRLWRLRREEVRSRYRTLGVPVAEWQHGQPVDGVLAQLREVRRYARTVRT
jgi:uncharacterized protein (DUF58 family)